MLSLNKSLIKNLILGIGLTFVVIYLDMNNYQWVSSLENTALDWMMQMRRGAEFSEEAHPFGYLDIDERAYQYLDEPYHTPRKSLKKIIQYAEQANSELIVLDIDLSRKGIIASEDQELVSFFKQYPESSPPIIIARTFSRSLSDPDTFLVKKSSIDQLEEVISKKENIEWASTLFPVESDGTIKNWRLWETVCNDGKKETVLSMQLLASAYTKNEMPLKGLNQHLIEQINKNVDENCNRTNTKTTIQVKDFKVDILHNSLMQRVYYSIPWKFKPNESSPKIVYENNSETDLIISRSVLPILQDKKTDKAWLKDRVVIIGGSYWDARDIHLTPFGDMPGAVILANSINTLNSIGLIERPSYFVQFLIIGLMIIVITVIFSKVSSFLGMIVGLAVSLVLLIPISYILFGYGIWLNFALPVIAIEISEIITEIKEEIENAKK